MFFSSLSLHKRKKTLYEKHFIKNELLYGKNCMRFPLFLSRNMDLKEPIGKDEGAVKTLFKNGVTVN